MGLDDQVTLLKTDVFETVGVDLQFVVAAAVRIYFNAPLGVVEGGTVEFVGLDELPVRGLGGMSRLEHAEQMECGCGYTKVDGFGLCHH